MDEFIRDDPFRMVSWRWERAGSVASGMSSLSRKRDDDWIRRAANYRRLAKKSAKRIERHILIERHPEIHYAHMLYLGRDDEGKQATPYMIEARTLARQNRDAIAQLVAVRPEIVEAYSKLFFDVEERLDATDYIYQAVMGPGINRGSLRMRQFDVIWKLAGYCGGPHMLDAVRAIMPSNWADTADDVDSAIDADNRRGQRRLAKLSFVTAQPSDNLSANAFMMSYWQMMRDESTAGSAAEARSKTHANVQAMMGGLKFSVGIATEHDTHAAELRGDELVRVAFGGPKPAAEELQLVKYPDKKPAALPPAAKPAG